MVRTQSFSTSKATLADGGSDVQTVTLLPVATWEFLRQTSCKVVLKRLPAGLCADEENIEAMLEQAGFESDVVTFHIAGFFGKGTARTCDVEVELSSLTAAWRAIRHFEGCCWGPAESAIEVELLTMDDCGGRCQDSQQEKPDSAKRSYAPRNSGRAWKACQADASQDGFSLLVAYFPKVATSLGLTRVFSRFGRVTAAKVMREAGGESKCYGFLEFTSRRSAESALRACEAGRVGMRDENGKIWYVKAKWSDKMHSLADGSLTDFDAALCEDLATMKPAFPSAASSPTCTPSESSGSTQRHYSPPLLPVRAADPDPEAFRLPLWSAFDSDDEQ